MGLFNRQPRPTIHLDHDDDGEETLQGHAGSIIEAITEFDEAWLARMTPEQRVEHRRARDLMYMFYDTMWESLKGQDLDPAADDRYSVVAGMRDLTCYLQSFAATAIHEIDGPDAEKPSPAVIARREAERQAAFKQWLETATVAELKAAQPTANPADVIAINGAIIKARGW